MSAPLWYLSPHALAEPLVDRWAAWWMTVAPVPASLHLLHYQLPLLQGYLGAPEFHARAAADPKMSGGAFVGVPPARAAEVKALLERTTATRQQALATARGFEQLQQALLAEAKGQALLPFYARVPEPLRGRVELVYDYTNRPAVRVVEPLTWASPAYQPELQSLQVSTLGQDADRGSWLSTPRLKEPNALEWSLPFRDERLDRFFALDHTPMPMGAIGDLVGSDVGAQAALFTTEAPALPAAWNGPGMRVCYLGHASAMVQWKGATVLVDPVLSPQPAGGGEPRVTFQQLPKQLDYVVITHAHADHFCLETLLRLRHRIGTLVIPRSSGFLVGDVSLALLCRQLGFPRVVELEALQTLPLPDGEIIAAPFFGEHGDLAHAKSAWVVRGGTQQVLFAADSACLEPAVYTELRRLVGTIQTVLMNTETEGSPLTFSMEGLFPKSRDRKLERDRLCRGSTSSEGIRLLEAVGAERVYNYAMGLEPWLEHITGHVDPTSNRMKDSDELIAESLRRGLTAARLRGPTELVLG